MTPTHTISTEAEGEVLTTDDADEASAAAAQLERQGEKVSIETVYDDGEPAATSVHAGARESEVVEERAAAEEAEKPAPKAKAKDKE